MQLKAALTLFFAAMALATPVAEPEEQAQQLDQADQQAQVAQNHGNDWNRWNDRNPWDNDGRGQWGGDHGGGHGGGHGGWGGGHGGGHGGGNNNWCERRFWQCRQNCRYWDNQCERRCNNERRWCGRR